MTLCGLCPCVNTSENCTLRQGLNMSYDISEDFPFLNIENFETHLLGGLVILISVFGMVGNGIVLWFLCLVPKSDPFIFITHLAVADFGALLVMFVYYTLFFIVYLYGHSHYVVCVLNLCMASLDLVMFWASALFLAAISADRCVAIFFPHWHRCHRPKSLPTIVSALLWPLASVVGGLIFYYDICLTDGRIEIILFLIFDSFIVLSILALLIRVYCYSHLCRRGRLLKVIMFSLFVFVITLVPQTFFLFFFRDTKKAYLVSDFLISLNSSANPVIYFFVGRSRGVPSRRSVRVVLQKVFKEEEDSEGRPSSIKSSFWTTY